MRYILTVCMAICLSLSIYAANMETRGIWIDKKQLKDGPEALDLLFGKLADANFNEVSLCAMFHGYLIYPDSEFLPQHPDYKEMDYLKMAIELAHKHNLKAYAWMEFGFYGYHNPDILKSKTMGPTFDAHPDWLSIDKNGSYYIHNKAWGDFLPVCPNNPEVHEFMSGMYKEVMLRYDFDGMDLDRIRYGNGDYCRCDTCRTLCKRDTGVDISKIKPGTDDFAIYVNWKKARLNLFVQKFTDEIAHARLNAPVKWYRKLNPFKKKPQLIPISSAVTSPENIDNYGQDWSTWAKYGWVDGLSPMLYTSDFMGAAKTCKEMLPEDFPLFVGVDCSKSDSDILIKKIEEARSAGMKGFFFWYAGTVEPHLDALKKSVFSEPAEPIETVRDRGPVYELPLPDKKKVSAYNPVENKEPGQE